MTEQELIEFGNLYDNIVEKCEKVLEFLEEWNNNHIPGPKEMLYFESLYIDQYRKELVIKYTIDLRSRMHLFKVPFEYFIDENFNSENNLESLIEYNKSL